MPDIARARRLLDVVIAKQAEEDDIYRADEVLEPDQISWLTARLTEIADALKEKPVAEADEQRTTIIRSVLPTTHLHCATDPETGLPNWGSEISLFDYIIGSNEALSALTDALAAARQEQARVSSDLIAWRNRVEQITADRDYWLDRARRITADRDLLQSEINQLKAAGEDRDTREQWAAWSAAIQQAFPTFHLWRGYQGWSAVGHTMPLATPVINEALDALCIALINEQKKGETS